MANKTGELRPEPTGVEAAESGTREADRLAGEPTREDVDAGGVCNGPDVSKVGDEWPVFAEDFTTEGVDLGHPAGTKPARSFESKVNASDSCEE
jgi:hypothetical protein